MRNRRIGILLGAALLLVVVARHPSADLRILTHDATDPAPHRFQAALDLGLMGISVLVTWTGKQLR
jgi:hypothetical protein